MHPASSVYAASIQKHPSSCHRQAHGPSRAAFQASMHGTGVADEVRPCPWIPGEELIRHHVAFQPIAWGAGGDEVAREVGAASRYGMDVIEGRRFGDERRAAIDAPPAAIAQRRAFERALPATFQR
jgi:hypothetical protein